MSDRVNQSESDPSSGGEFELDLTLPDSVVDGLKAAAGASPEVPAYIDVAVMGAFDEHRRRTATRRQAWRFAGIAACVAILVGIGSTQLFRAPKSVPGWRSSELAGAVANGQAAPSIAMPGSTGGERALATRNSGVPAIAEGAAPAADAVVRARAVLATIDADHNGRVDVLDVLRVAKTIESVRIARDLRAKGLEKDAEAFAGGDAYWVASLDVTWDLTSDGSVDQRDVDLLAVQIVQVGAS